LEKEANSFIAEDVSPRNRNYGVMLPYTPLHYLLLSEDELTVLVMTSGNISEEPIAIDNEEAFERLPDIADYLTTIAISISEVTTRYSVLLTAGPGRSGEVEDMCPSLFF
jgi:hydrogenase maturation factor HypF (carbamoyltransferase family)